MGAGGAALGVIRLLVVPGAVAVGATLPLDPAEAHHMAVRRVAPGASATALDGRGAVGTGRLVRQGEAWALRVEVAWFEPRPPETVIAVGAGDRDRFLLVAEKAAELGVTRVIPLLTAATQGVASRVRDSTVDKARRRVRDACKQSGTAWTPLIDDLRPVDQLRNAFPSMRWLLADSRGAPCGPIGANEPVGWLIGPEAGFTLVDIEVVDNVLRPQHVGLSPHVLRFETAAISAMAVTAQRRLESLRERTG